MMFEESGAFELARASSPQPAMRRELNVGASVILLGTASVCPFCDLGDGVAAERNRSPVAHAGTCLG